MKIEFTEKEAAAICHGLKNCGYIFTHKSWVLEICKRFEEAAKAARKAAVALAVALCVANAGAATLDLQSVAAKLAETLTEKLAKVTNKTTRVSALASPENYALLKSTKLKDAAAKLALQKQLAEAAIADADEDEKQRLKWHGAYARQSVDMENLKATFYHADGYAVTVGFAKPKLEEEVKTANKKLPKLAETNGVPVKLAEARARRNEEKQNPVIEHVEVINANALPRYGR